MKNQEVKEVIGEELEYNGLFSHRESIQEALDYALSYRDIGTTTAVLVMLNTIAKNYRLVKKD
jgi:hypothetical protein